MERKKSSPNEGEGNRTAAKRYNTAAKRHAEDSDTEGIARDAARDMDQLFAQLQHFDVGMLVTERADGRLAARPMYVADRADDGSIRFVVRRDAAVVEELREEPSVVVTFQAGKRYLSLTAHAEMLDEPGIPESVWREEFRPWFPDGPSSTNAIVLNMVPEEAEYWDQSGIQSMRLYLAAALSYLKGEPVSDERVKKQGHAKLSPGSPRVNAPRS